MKAKNSLPNKIVAFTVFALATVGSHNALAQTLTITDLLEVGNPNGNGYLHTFSNGQSTRSVDFASGTGTVHFDPVTNTLNNLSAMITTVGGDVITLTSTSGPTGFDPITGQQTNDSFINLTVPTTVGAGAGLIPAATYSVLFSATSGLATPRPGGSNSLTQGTDAAGNPVLLLNLWGDGRPAGGGILAGFDVIFQLSPTTVVPIPPAILFLGTALLGMFGLRARAKA